MKNEKGVTEWINGRSAENRTLKSNGVQLFSYALKIAEHVPFTNESFLWDYTTHGEFVSQTTSKHVGLVRGIFSRARMGYVLIDPSQPQTRADLVRSPNWSMLDEVVLDIYSSIGFKFSICRPLKSKYPKSNA